MTKKKKKKKIEPPQCFCTKMWSAPLVIKASFYVIPFKKMLNNRGRSMFGKQARKYNSININFVNVCCSVPF